MNLSEICFDKLEALCKEVRQSHEKLNKAQSAVDRHISDIYHQIERSEGFNMSEGDAYARKLKEALHKRRLIKDELARLYPVYDVFRNGIDEVDDHYRRAVRKSFNRELALKEKVNLSDIFEEFGIEY
ncbi:hypothetical protein AABM38_10070 [Heyndrickxia sp. MSNUG]|uniref:hypothetical protein n=1 Tax=Heyndrickxia sp. MSNUG TaxID=3136677 RepID=UPI003C2B4464